MGTDQPIPGEHVGLVEGVSGWGGGGRGRLAQQGGN